ncbi:Dabb family protein [Micromonospora sp. WMMD812]|uniref:Dabb family protein n=1 Tax=Micromonospora sp. WMMD812 TaxID=3015152 RepID=UPI00248D2250|nr:Dabb family protein [Micromonospora sp. WMMD812]WBB70067.1 Dabb family protein [Micromonospora sp. WMMD812]
MIYHQIRISMKPDAPKGDVAHALEMLRRLGRELDVVEQWAVGRDFGGEFEYGAMYALKDIDAYRAYMYAPLHRKIDEIGLPLVDNMVSLDLTDDEDPAIGDKIAQIHAERFAGDAALTSLVEGLGSYEGSGTTPA